MCNEDDNDISGFYDGWNVSDNVQSTVRQLVSNLGNKMDSEDHMFVKEVYATCCPSTGHLVQLTDSVISQSTSLVGSDYSGRPDKLDNKNNNI